MVKRMSKMHRTVAHVAILLFFLGVSATTLRAEEPAHRVVSLVELLTRPRDFEGEIVLVQGYLTSRMRLYLTKDHAEIADSPSSILVEATGPGLMKCADAYVAVNGVFGRRDNQYAIVKTLEISRWADPRSRGMDKAWVSICWKREAEE